MTYLATWLQILVALLVMPVVAGGSMVSQCGCHKEVVFIGGCSCDHDHAEEHGSAPERETERDEHHCTHVENELRFVSPEVELPVFPAEYLLGVTVPNFRLNCGLMHCCVARAMVRARQWDPPDTVSAPLLI